MAMSLQRSHRQSRWSHIGRVGGPPAAGRAGTFGSYSRGPGCPAGRAQRRRRRPGRPSRTPSRTRDDRRRGVRLTAQLLLVLGQESRARGRQMHWPSGGSCQ